MTKLILIDSIFQEFKVEELQMATCLMRPSIYCLIQFSKRLLQGLWIYVLVWGLLTPFWGFRTCLIVYWGNFPFKIKVLSAICGQQVWSHVFAFLPSSAQLANKSRQFGWLVLIPQSPQPDRQAGRQARKVVSGQDRAWSSNTNLFPSMSKHRKYF